MSGTLSAAREFLFNPILEKDLRSTARSLKFFLFIVGFLFVACIPLLVFTSEMHSRRSNMGRELFDLMFIIQAICVGLAIPSYACTSVASERQRRTFDLLRITSLKPWEILWGKFIAIQSYIIVFAVAFLPLMSICFLYGGTDPGYITKLYLHLLVSSAVCSAFCLMLSAASSNSIKTIIVGYIFIIVASFAWGGVAVGGLGLGGGRRGATGFALFSFDSLLVFSTLAFLWSLFYLAATSLLKPASWNKSTSLRVWYTLCVLASLAFFHLLTRTGIRSDDLAGYLLCFVGIPSVFAAVGFCGEPAELAPRLRAKVSKTPVVLRIFAPGKRSAAIFVRLIFLLAAGGAMLVFAFRAPDRSFDEGPYFALGLLCYVNFCCALTAAMRSMWDSPRSRIIAIATIIALMLLPMLALLDFNRHHPLAGIIWISPPVALMDHLENVYGRIDSGPAFYFIFYIAASLIAFFLGLACSARRKRQQRSGNTP